MPADCVLIKVADNKPECFVSTSPLDGERNLKPKLASLNISKHFESLFDNQASKQSVKLSLDCIPPIKDLYSFGGCMKLKLDEETKSKNFKLTIEQFLHRGSFVENSGHVLALVCYTGVQSKLILNLG